jgi:hypothetical protein
VRLVLARILAVPASRNGLGPFYQDVIAVDPLEPYGIASAAHRLGLLACTLPFPVGGARLVPSREAARLLRALHSWPVPGDLAGMLAGPVADPDLLHRAGAELVLLPPSSALGLIPVARQLPFVDQGVLDAAAGRIRDLGDVADTEGDILLHGDFYLSNVLVRDGHANALIDVEFARTGPPDLELISVDTGHPLHTLWRLVDAPLPFPAERDFRIASP